MDIELYLSNSTDSYAFGSDIPKNVSVSIPAVYVKKGFGIPPEAITIIISTAKEIAVGVLSAWLYDKLKNHKSNKITINRKEITLEKGEITKIIMEQIEAGQ